MMMFSSDSLSSPDLVRLVEAETGPVDHLAHRPLLLVLGTRGGLAEQEDGLVLLLPRDVQDPGHLPA